MFQKNSKKIHFYLHFDLIWLLRWIKKNSRKNHNFTVLIAVMSHQTQSTPTFSKTKNWTKSKLKISTRQTRKKNIFIIIGAEIVMLILILTDPFNDWSLQQHRSQREIFVFWFRVASFSSNPSIFIVFVCIVCVKCTINKYNYYVVAGNDGEMACVCKTAERGRSKSTYILFKELKINILKPIHSFALTSPHTFK